MAIVTSEILFPHSCGLDERARNTDEWRHRTNALAQGLLDELHGAQGGSALRRNP